MALLHDELQLMSLLADICYYHRDYTKTLFDPRCQKKKTLFDPQYIISLGTKHDPIDIGCVRSASFGLFQLVLAYFHSQKSSKTIRTNRAIISLGYNMYR